MKSDRRQYGYDRVGLCPPIQKPDAGGVAAVHRRRALPPHLPGSAGAGGVTESTPDEEIHDSGEKGIAYRVFLHQWYSFPSHLPGPVGAGEVTASTPDEEMHDNGEKGIAYRVFLHQWYSFPSHLPGPAGAGRVTRVPRIEKYTMMERDTPFIVYFSISGTLSQHKEKAI